MIFWTHEAADTTLVEIGSVVQQVLDHGRVFVDDGDV